MSEGFLPEPHPSEPKAGSPALRRAAVPARYRFGLYEADPRTGELLREGRKIKLQEQPFQVLLALLERPNEIVTREELRLRLWPSDTFVDFDHGLNTAINKLRDALRDSASNPRFIETLARRGYRFLAPVEAVEPASSAEPLPAVLQVPADVRDPALPRAHRGTVRALFALSQILYLSMYIAALAHLHQVDAISERLFAISGTWVVVAVIVTCAVGIPLRLYLLTAIALRLCWTRRELPAALCRGSFRSTKFGRWRLFCSYPTSASEWPLRPWRLWFICHSPSARWCEWLTQLRNLNGGFMATGATTGHISHR